ncbi:MAG TPA: GNAT family N-acetyltransferase [Pedococcus sp.]|nr:GNAT family N-acetyltransferase [Pedococcus sp.]
MTELRTDRLLLRHWREEDREPFAALNDDPAVMEHFPHHLTREQSDAMADRIATFLDEHGWGLWAVEVLDTGQFIGFTGLAVPRFEEHFTPCVEVGWRLARDGWGHGYATEAARASVAHGFTELGLEEIVAMVVPANDRSQSVMRKLGMTRDEGADFDHPLVEEGSPVRRHRLYRLAREEWARGAGSSSGTATGAGAGGGAGSGSGSGSGGGSR